MPKKAPKPFTVAHCRAWASDLIADTDEPFKFQGFQEAFLRDLFSGKPECWLVVPEGNGKTTLLALLALYHCEFRPFAAVHVAAASRENADNLYGQAEGFVLRSPRLHERIYSELQEAKGKQKTEVPRFQCLGGFRRINHAAGGRIQIFAADDRTGDGTLPTLAVIDEPHRHRDLKLYRTWSGKLHKRKGQIVAISTAGDPTSDFELTRARIREAAKPATRKGAFTRWETDRLVMHEWALPDADDPADFKAVKRANPLKSITVPALREKYESPSMTMAHWMRFVCNRPTQDQECWLGDDALAVWTHATKPYDFHLGAPTWVGLDVAIKRDTSAVVAVQRRPDGRFHAKATLWTPTEDKPVDVTDIMRHLRDAAARYDVRAISFDPRFFDVPAKYLEDEGLPMIEIPQSVERMTVAVGGAFEDIKSGRVTHDDDPVFMTHILNAVPRYNERGFTLAKSKSRGHIDAAVALCLALERVERQETSPSIEFIPLEPDPDDEDDDW